MIRKVTKQRQEEQLLEWPESFYGVKDPEKRKEALTARIAEGKEPEENQLRMELWERRYGGKEKNSGEIDYFIRAWMSLRYIYGNRKSFFYGRKMKRDLAQVRADLCLEWGEEPGSLKEQLLYDELFHMGNCYIDLCLSDKSYSSVLMGMGQMKDTTLHNKIGQEIRETLYELPREAKMEREFRVLTQAVTDCYNEKFPNSSVRLDA